MPVKPLDQLVLVHAASGAVFDQVGKGIDVSLLVQRILKIQSVLIQKGDGDQCTSALIAVHEGVAFHEIKTECPGNSRYAAMGERVTPRIKRGADRAFDFSDIVAMMGIAALFADLLIHG